MQTSSEIVRTMLRMSEVTTSPMATCTKPLSANEIFRSLPPSYNILRPILDQYLTLLVDDPVWPANTILCFLIFFFLNKHVVFCLFIFFSSSFLRWSSWGRLVKAEEGCLLSVSFFRFKRSWAFSREPAHWLIWLNSGITVGFLSSSLRSAQSTGQSGTGHTRVCSTGEVSQCVC